MKIYTRTGDKGQTGLLGGVRVPKDDPRIEAYGSIDELNAHLGMLRDLAPGHADLIAMVQDRLFSIGSLLAAGEADPSRFKIPPVQGSDVDALERAMDGMDTALPPMRHFILPGGHAAISQAHICRTVCRRAERRVVTLAGQQVVDPLHVRYLNRLSDLLFMIARHLHHVMKVPEARWPRNA